MKFFCFPKQQDHYIVYSSYLCFKSKLFSDFVLQASPKNSIFFQTRKTLLGHLLGHLDTVNIETPTDGEFVGIVKKKNPLLISFKAGIPKEVWRKNEMEAWVGEEFIGYQLISAYTLSEFQSKIPLIEKAFEIHWRKLMADKTAIHGDFTHFNILVDAANDIHFIDPKSSINSKLFDYFYFYGYLRQCLERCLTLPKKNRIMILALLENVLLKTCNYDSNEELAKDLSSIKIPEVTGIITTEKEKYLNDFKEIFISGL